MPLLTPAKLRAELNISEATYDMMLRDNIPCVRLSKKPNAHRRFDLEKVMAWLEERSEVKEDGGEQPG